MSVVYHSFVQRDVSQILRYYDRISNRLGDEFWEELNFIIKQASTNPKHFHFETRDRRRANLKRFPYHFLFRESASGIRVTVVRHNKQHPKRGLERM